MRVRRAPKRGASQLIDEVERPKKYPHGVGAVSPFADSVSLPIDVRETIDIARSACAINMPSFPKRRIDAILFVKQSVEHERKAWYKETPPIISGPAGIIDVPLWPYPIRDFDHGHRGWVAQFVSGFPKVCGRWADGAWAGIAISPTLGDLLIPMGSPNPNGLFATSLGRFKQRFKPMKFDKPQLLRG